MNLELTDLEARVLSEFIGRLVTGPVEGPRGTLDAIYAKLPQTHLFAPRLVNAPHIYVEPGEAW